MIQLWTAMISTLTNTLPDLPRKLQKREQSITPRVLEWFNKNFPFSVALEIKATKTASIPPSALLPHQLQALLAVQSEAGLTHKISDAGRIRQPFDAFQMKKTRSFVVCVFLSHKVCLAIDPAKWNGASINSTNQTFSIPLW